MTPEQQQAWDALRQVPGQHHLADVYSQEVGFDNFEDLAEHSSPAFAKFVLETARTRIRLECQNDA